MDEQGQLLPLEDRNSIPGLKTSKNTKALTQQEWQTIVDIVLKWKGFNERNNLLSEEEINEFEKMKKDYKIGYDWVKQYVVDEGTIL